MPSPFSVTYDYRCPFARNVHEHLVAGQRDGAAWDVTFTPFSLTQVHVEEGALPVWENEAKAGHLLAVEAGLVVRDSDPARFFAVHLGLFAARHDDGRDLGDPTVVAEVLTGAGVDADAVLRTVAGGGPRAVFRAEHEAAVNHHKVFGVPTFVRGERAVFVRVTTRPDGDGALARRTVDGVLSLLDTHPELNEFKHTTIAR